jgi:hypothetical protein
VLLFVIYWTIKTIVGYKKAADNYAILFKKRECMRKSMSKCAMEELQSAQEEDLRIEEYLLNWFKKYKILMPKERIFESLEKFQDQYQKDILAIQEKAKRRVITLPTPFPLADLKTDKIINSNEELLRLSKLEFTLLWIGEQLCEYPQLKIIKFSFDKNFRKLEFIKAEELGSLTLVINTNGLIFQKLVKDILISNYFLVIEKITIENGQRTVTDYILENQDDSIKKIAPSDKLNISLKIKFIDFDL